MVRVANCPSSPRREGSYPLTIALLRNLENDLPAVQKAVGHKDISLSDFATYMDSRQVAAQQQVMKSINSFPQLESFKQLSARDGKLVYALEGMHAQSSHSGIIGALQNWFESPYKSFNQETLKEFEQRFHNDPTFAKQWSKKDLAAVQNLDKHWNDPELEAVKDHDGIVGGILDSNSFFEQTNLIDIDDSTIKQLMQTLSSGGDFFAHGHKLDYNLVPANN